MSAIGRSMAAADAAAAREAATAEAGTTAKKKTGDDAGAEASATPARAPKRERFDPFGRLEPGMKALYERERMNELAARAAYFLGKPKGEARPKKPAAGGAEAPAAGTRRPKNDAAGAEQPATPARPAPKPKTERTRTPKTDAGGAEAPAAGTRRPKNDAAGAEAPRNR